MSDLIITGSNFVQTNDVSTPDGINSDEPKYDVYLADVFSRCNTDVDKEFIAVLESGDLNEVIFFFEWCDHNNICIVGTCGYLFTTKSILNILSQAKIGQFAQPRYVPQTLGFRYFYTKFRDNYHSYHGDD